MRAASSMRCCADSCANGVPCCSRCSATSRRAGTCRPGGTLREAYPQQWEALAASANVRPPMTLRVNTARVPVADYLTRLANAGLAGKAIGPQAVRLVRAFPVSQIPGFTRGDVSVQDAGAQLAAPLLEVADGIRVLDACAAPGGKTGHLLELARLDVTALESDAKRAERIHENLARLGQQAEVVVGDASRPADWWDGRQYDRILPTCHARPVSCAATRTSAGCAARSISLAWSMSSAASCRNCGRCSPGGILLYVTCSIFPTEGEEQARWFGAQLPDAIRLQAPGQILPSTGHHDGAPGQASLPSDHDGFSTPASRNDSDPIRCRARFACPSSRPLATMRVRPLLRRPRRAVARPAADGTAGGRGTAAGTAAGADASRRDRSQRRAHRLLRRRLRTGRQFRIRPAGTARGRPEQGNLLYFVVDFQLSRPRWYWFDEKPVNTSRNIRLSYHPLTRQYRISTGGLQLPFTRLKAALQFIQRVRGWRVFERNAVRLGETYQAEVRMRLDLTQLPKPFQINAVNTRDWNLASDWRRFNYTVPTELNAAPPASVPVPRQRAAGAGSGSARRIGHRLGRRDARPAAVADGLHSAVAGAAGPASRAEPAMNSLWDSKFRRVLYRIVAAVIVFLALVLVGLLIGASGNTEFFDRYFTLLFKINLVIGVLLVAIIGALALTLWIRYRRGKFGTRLMTSWRSSSAWSACCRAC